MASPIITTARTSLSTSLIRVSLYTLLTLLLIPIQVVGLLLRLPISKSLPMWYHRMCCRILGIRIEVFGRRSRTRPTLFIANHASYLDIAIYGALIQVSFVAKAEVENWPIFGLLAKLQNSVFVDRKVRTSRLQANSILNRLEKGDHPFDFGRFDRSAKSSLHERLQNLCSVG